MIADGKVMEWIMDSVERRPFIGLSCWKLGLGYLLLSNSFLEHLCITERLRRAYGNGDKKHSNIDNINSNNSNSLQILLLLLSL